MSESEEPAGRRPPREYFAPGQWPNGTPSEPDGEAALYAAALCVFVRACLDEEHTLASFERLTNVAYGQLRHVLDGDRWVGLETVARIELALGRRATGLDVVNARLADERRATRRRSRKQSPSTPVARPRTSK